MIKVLIIKNWSTPDLLRQTPGRKGVWSQIHFTFDMEDECGYAVIFNYSAKNVRLHVHKENVWCLMQEPPNEYFKYRHKANKVYYRVFTQDQGLIGERYIHSPPALPWHVDKSYDELVRIKKPQKKLPLSFITSNKKSFTGHKERMFFLDRIKGNVNFDLFGYGIRPLKNKWDGLAPYRYSLVVENYRGPYYWSEKLADCFLAWTMPIYYGCTNLSDYFPKDSYIHIDINSPDIISRINEVVKSDLWRKHEKAVSYARELILKKYQFFPYFADKIRKWQKQKKRRQLNIGEVTIPDEDTFIHNLKLKIKGTLNPSLR